MKLTTFGLILTLLLGGQFAYGQKSSCDATDKVLAKLYGKISPFFRGNEDSLEYYSSLFSNQLISYVKSNPATMDCKFKLLADGNSCSVATTADGLLRIYSWDTWLGGTMRNYRNIYQFKSGDKVRTIASDENFENAPPCYTDVFTLKANGKVYFLRIGRGSESTKDAFETISLFTISKDTIDNSVKLIKTASGLRNSLLIEYNIFSVANNSEKSIRLIKYDPLKKMIYIPVVWKDGKVTKKYIRYQFTGEYFEKIAQ